MNINTSVIKQILSNKLILYILSRYGIYFIQFLNSILIAIYLGPYYLGIWGFISLVLSYINQFDLGISHSANAIISINKDENDYIEKIVGTSMTMLFGLSFLVTLFFLGNYCLNTGIGDKYNFNSYALIVALTGIFGFYNSLFSKVFRVFGRVMEMAFNQSIFPILMLIALLLFKGENLLWSLVIANLIAFLLSLCLYLFRSPIRLRISFSKELWKIIQIKAWHLFIYNTSFYLIIISTRTFVSSYYPVEDFGYFTFAFALANAFLMFLDSISSLIYPKMLNRMAKSSLEKAVSIIELMRNSYITIAHLLIHIAVAVVPFFFLFLPQYVKSGEAFHLVALTILLDSNSYGYSGLLIAKGKERRIGGLSFTAFIINVVAIFILVEIVNVPFAYVILGTMFSYCIYVFMVGKMGRKEMEMDCSWRKVIEDVFPLKLALPFFLSLAVSILSASSVFLFLPLMLFIVLNYKTIKGLKPVATGMILNSKIIDI